MYDRSLVECDDFWSFHNTLYGSYLLEHKIDDVGWIRVLDSGIPGPTLVISSHVHGGESPWTQTQYMLDIELRIKKYLRKGKIILVLWNEEGYLKYLETWEHKQGRFIKENMNRIDIEKLENNTSSEAQRLQNLIKALFSKLKIWDMHIDLHSTSAPSEPFAITSKYSRNMINILNVEQIFEWIIEVQAGKPVIHQSEIRWAMSGWIELSDHNSLIGYLNGVDNILRACLHLALVTEEDIKNMIKWTDLQFPLPNLENEHYTIIGSHIVESDTFIFSNPNIKNLTPVRKWYLIGHDWEKPIYSEKDCIIVLPNTKTASKGNEAFFIANIESAKENEVIYSHWWLEL